MITDISSDMLFVELEAGRALAEKRAAAAVVIMLHLASGAPRPPYVVRTSWPLHSDASALEQPPAFHDGCTPYRPSGVA